MNTSRPALSAASSFFVAKKSRQKPQVSSVVIIPLLSLLYFVSGKLGLQLASLNPSATPVWLPTGIVIAACLFCGLRVWPGVFIGAFLVNITTQGNVSTSLAIATGNTLEAVLAAYLTTRFANGVHAFEASADVMKFVIVGSLATAAVSATFGTTSLALGGFAAWNLYPAIWMTWWLGNVLGGLLVAPVLTLWAIGHRSPWSAWKIFEGVCLLASSVLVGAAVFHGLLPAARDNQSIVFLALPVLAWAALRFSPRETATVSLVLSSLAIWGTIGDSGPFAAASPGSVLGLLQVFLCVNCITALVLAVVCFERKIAQDHFRSSETRFRLIFEEAAVGVAQMDSTTGRFIRANQRYCDMVGIKPEDMPGITFMEITHPDDLDGDLRNMEALKEGRIRRFAMEKRYLRQDGGTIWVDLTVSPMWAPGHRPNYHIAVVQDITERKRLEAELQHANEELEGRVARRTRELIQANQELHEQISERRRAEHWLGGLLEAAPDAMIIANEKGVIVLVNSQTEKMFGYSREELIGCPVEVLMPSRFAANHPGHRAHYARDPRFRPMGAGRELQGLKKDGAEFPIELSLAPMQTENGLFVSSSIRDVTDRKRADTLLRNSLQEKEILLKEIHHRVKNNLTTISSLFYLQSTQTSDRDTLQILANSQDRVRSIALVHEALYRSESFAEVDFAEYARELVGQLVITHGLTDGRVRLRTKLMPVRMTMEMAIPCGLILNEMISNAMKHAFTPGDSGEIMLELQNHFGSIVLRVADNGIGLPVADEEKPNQSLGLRLIRSLTAQIEGQFELRRANPGTEARLSLELIDDSRNS